jgi:hypothetical protein
MQRERPVLNNAIGPDGAGGRALHPVLARAAWLVFPLPGLATSPQSDVF